MSAGAELLGVPRQAARQPHCVGGADSAGHLGLHLFTAHGGVAAGIELDGVGEQDGALPVDLNATALVDQS